MREPRGGEADEPGLVVQGPRGGYDESNPRERAADQGRDHCSPVPAAVKGVSSFAAIEIAEFELLLADEPVVGNQHARDRSETARVTNQPREDVARRIAEQSPRLHEYADDAGDESAGAKRDPLRKRVCEVVRGRDDVRGDVDREGRDHDREHRDRYHYDALNLPDGFHRIPEPL